MKTILFLVGFICLFNSRCFSQSFILSDLSSLSDHITYMENRKNEESFYRNIDGIPWLSEDFKKGEVILNDSLHFKNVPLRYNAYNDKIEFKDNKKQVLEIDNSQQNGKYCFDNSLFVSCNYIYEGQSKKGILELLVNGQIQLYKKYTIEFKEATKAIGFQDAQPNRLERLEDEYLIAEGEDSPRIINKNKKVILSKLKQFKTDIEQYAKKNKLNPKSEKDLILLVRYCNE